MTLAVVFGFAVQDGLIPVVNAAPYDVLARQLPRQLVQLLNAGVDRGVRFFPFLANSGGKRTFLRLHEALPIATLASLHQNPAVRGLVDGTIGGTAVQMRIYDHAQRLLREFELPFDPRRPCDMLLRMQFEIMSEFGWEGRPQSPPPVGDVVLAWLLIAKDELLAFEAAIAPESDADPLRAVRSCIEFAPDVVAVQDVAIETVAFLLRSGQRLGEAVLLLNQLAAAAPATFQLCRRIGALQQAAGDLLGSAATWTRAAMLQPDNAEAVELAASLWFRCGNTDEALSVLVRIRQHGTLSVAGLGQLAAVADRRGDRVLRDQITSELLAVPMVPLSVARLLTSFLLEDGRASEALAVAERTLARHPQDASLWLEAGRARLILEDNEGAGVALRRSLEQGLSGEPRRDADRLLRLAKVPGLFSAMRLADKALSVSQQEHALHIARQLVRSAADSAEAWLFFGIVRQRLGQTWRSERALRNALRLDGNLGEAHNRLGVLLVSKGNLDEGLQHLLRAELLSPVDPSPRLHLAQAFALLGRAADGEREMVQAERLGANPLSLAAIRQKFFAKGA
ncbi:MAG: tetratricopeptide repeat protein [Planctomycetes bacterium]|nr:tetratricopeptide repeat protein [Planctomycetota bacterium]